MLHGAGRFTIIYHYLATKLGDFGQGQMLVCILQHHGSHLGLSENRFNIPNEIAIFHRDNDQQNHWV